MMKYITNPLRVRGEFFSGDGLRPGERLPEPVKE